MNESLKKRMHRHLDAEARQAEFTPEEIREIEAYEAIISETGKLYRSIEVPDLAARVMARIPANAPAGGAAEVRRTLSIRGLASTPLGRVVAWLWAPRSVRLRPAYGVATAITLILLVIVMRPNNLPPQEVAQTSDVATAAAKIFVQFRLDAPQASAVHLVGSFTEWKPTYTLHESAPGIWSVLVPLGPGVHDYAFLVNGKWITDPIAPLVDDGFGGANSRLMVVLPDSSSRL